MTTARHQLIVTGWSLCLPGIRPDGALAKELGPFKGAWAAAESPPPDQAAAVLGRKGLLYKEPATRLALCAVHRALGLPAGQRPVGTLSPRTAVVACSNLGNVETVSNVTRTVAAEGGRAVSVLDAPNVSSNIIASTVALWYRFGGPNLMVCSGTTAGLDGLRLAALLLRARRAERVVLVGAEPADDVAASLHTAGDPRWPLRAGAACLILEAPDAGSAPGRALVEILPGTTAWPHRPEVAIGPGGVDLAAHWGDHDGAEGVVALALAAHLAVDEGRSAVGVRCEGEDGSRAALVSPAAG